jgi:hypothetical protein
MTTVTLIPAFGRDYQTRKQVEADWVAGKDFKIASYFNMQKGYCGSYTSIRDWENATVRVRFNRLRNVCTLKGIQPKKTVSI